MSRALLLTASIAVATALVRPAGAEVSAMQVWESWKRLAESGGQAEITGTVTATGEKVTVTDLVMTMVAPEAEITGRLDEIVFRERPDGTVLVTMSPRYDVAIETREGGATSRMRLAVEQEGLVIVASGDAEEVAYDYTAVAMRVSTEEVAVGDEPVDMDLSAVIPDVKGSYRIGMAEPTPIAGDFSAGGLDLKVRAVDPEVEGRLDVALSLQNVDSRFAGTLMPVDPENLAAALRAGFAVDMTLAHGPASYVSDFADREDAFTLRAEQSSGGLEFALSERGMRYRATSSDAQFRLSGNDIPLPEVAFSIGRLVTAVGMPILASETPQDLDMELRLEELALSDMIWSVIDPAGQLPHDPATVVVDVDGKANWAFDIMDPEAAEKMEGKVPGELHSLDLNELRVVAAGAELTGTGGFTFDNADLTTFGGVPRPTGAVDLVLRGGNALLDRLVAMGILPQDQAMGVRMMSAMFARPSGEDELSSRIEITKDGAVYANGQRLR
ncbi:hypothetical protein SAMN05216257_101503 [Meinhardsimonia xiamenensis]|uniref:DUF2125 domain-containing protein n=1 Tax=Meinhardsimonia xiamenensis TaxID=990712 RepID=A0A1G8YZ79_9RHOB|nr:DUF2125 domain-containing protein [Meinhardsimonia xiamenensis]PRX37480.1 uncharacterized protein DUF2125 [Meinhardsimonia xiamenensis]SDK07704.1 hypothetical protein SAMN05216257_101503 [Meinhardsimonia xiamenensis]